MATPCSTCVRFGNKDCDVVETPAAAPKTPEIEQLRLRLEQLERLVMDAETGDEMSFHDDMRRTLFRSLFELRHLGLFRWLALVSLDANIFAAMLRLWPWSKEHLGQNPRDAQPSLAAAPQAAFCLGPYDVPVADTTALASSLRAVLPLRKHLWMLVDRYFAAVYAQFPVLDEQEFRAAVERVAGPRALVDEPVAVDKIALPDVVVWGTLLVVLRLAHLSVFSVAGKSKQQCFFTLPADMEYLASAPVIPRDAALVALACLAHYDLVRQALVEVIQLTALLRLHVMVDPGFASPDVKNHSFSAVLTLLALCRWLNRDPATMFTEESLSPRRAQLLRKIWYVVLDLDYTFAAHAGNPPMIARHAYDVRPPVFTAAALNLSDTHMDAAVCRTICDFEDIRVLLDDTLALSGNVARPVKVAAVEAVLARLWSKLAHLEHTYAGPPLDGVDAYTRTVRKQQFLQLLFVVMAMLTHVYYHYVRRGTFDRAKRERMSILRFICTLLLPLTCRFVREDEMPLDGPFDLFTGVYFLHCLWYCMLFLFSFYLDYRAHWTRVKNDPLHLSRLVPGSEYAAQFSALEGACNSIGSLLDFSRSSIARFLSHHQFARKILTVTSKLLEACKPEFYTNCNVVSSHTATMEENNECTAFIADFLTQNVLASPLGDTTSPVSPSVQLWAANSLQVPLMHLHNHAAPPDGDAIPTDISWLPDYNQFELGFDWILLDLLLSG